jgi:hypothetical protein
MDLPLYVCIRCESHNQPSRFGIGRRPNSSRRKTRGGKGSEPSFEDLHGVDIEQMLVVCYRRPNRVITSVEGELRGWKGKLNRPRLKRDAATATYRQEAESAGLFVARVIKGA